MDRSPLALREQLRRIDLELQRLAELPADRTPRAQVAAGVAGMLLEVVLERLAEVR